jgi:multidrug efflux pump subunit AcrB
MSLVAFAVQRWQLTAVIFFLFAALGVQAFLNIPRSADPHFPVPTIVIVVALPGADAAEIEETVAKPIEEAVQGIDRVKEIRSTSNTGVAVIATEFDYGTDADQSLDRVVRDVNALRSQLPSGIARIDFRRVRTTEAAVVQLALVSENASWRRMEKYAQDIRDEINVVPGVRATTIFGVARPEMRVAIDAGRLAEAGIAPTVVANAIAGGGATIAAGSINAGDRRFNVDAGGAYRSVQAIEGSIIKGEPGRFVTVGDVAKVEWAEAEHLHITRYNGKRAVFIAVKQKDSVSAPALRLKLAAATSKLQANLPPDMRLETGFDQTLDIKRRLSQLAGDFAIALSLVLITLIPLGWRASLVVVVSIPLSLAMGVFALAQFGFTLNQISISGFIISLGLLVDDSIVVTENIERHLRGGEGTTDAAISGTKEISLAVIGSTGVLLFAFLPLTFLPETSGDFVRGLPAAVLVTIASSLIVSLTIIPFVASRLLRDNHGPDGNKVLQAINRAIHRFYQPILRWGLRHPKTTVWGSMAICFSALGTLPFIGASLFPASDSPYFMVRVETPEGSGMAATDRAVRDVSKIVSTFPGITGRMDNVGRGNPQIFYNNIPREDDTRFGEVFVTIEKWSPQDSPRQLDQLRRKFDAYPDAKVTVIQFENGPPVEAPVAIRLRGAETGSLKTAAAQVAELMETTPGLRDIDNPLAIDRVDLDIGFDPASASLLGVTPIDIRRSVRLALAGERAGSFRDEEGDNYPIVVRLPMADNQPITALKSIYVSTQSGGSVPLEEVATPRLKSVPSQINRYQLQRTVTIKAQNNRGALPSKLNKALIAKLERTKFPPGISWEVGGAAEVAAKNTSGLSGVILIALFGIFAVLVAEFGRFRDVAVVAGVIPLGLFGGIVALLATGNSVSFMAIIGFVALIGIEIKNSILLVDFTTRLREQGLSLMDAIERAGEIRFLPVLLTSVTAIGGLLPLALSGAPLYAPLAWVIIGGLVSSTFLSRVVTPVMYLLIVRGGDAESNANSVGSATQ